MSLVNRIWAMRVSIYIWNNTTDKDQASFLTVGLLFMKKWLDSTLRVATGIPSNWLDKTVGSVALNWLRLHLCYCVVLRDFFSLFSTFLISRNCYFSFCVIETLQNCLRFSFESRVIYSQNIRYDFFVAF